MEQFLRWRCGIISLETSNKYLCAAKDLGEWHKIDKQFLKGDSDTAFFEGEPNGLNYLQAWCDIIW